MASLDAQSTDSAAAIDADPRPERLIALVRLGLAAGGLVALWIDPTQPRKSWEVAYAAFVLYVLYSAIIFHRVRGPFPRWLPLVTQAVDLLWIVPVVYFTEAANTPFFPFFVTFTLAAGIRWGRWGSWLVCLYSLVVYAFLLFVETPTPLDLNNDLMRIGYLLVVGVLGGYLTEYRRQRERDMRTLRLAARVIGAPQGAVQVLGTVVDIARGDRLADDVVGLLREPDGDGFVLVRGAGAVTRLGDEEGAVFLAALARPAEADGHAIPLRGADDLLLGMADADHGAAYPIRAGDELVGAIVLFYRESGSREAAPRELTTLFLRQVVPHIETLCVLERAPQARVMEERRRIARDLHDSFVQALASVGVRLDVLRASAGALPGAAALGEDLGRLREMVGDEQRRVRAYVTEMRDPFGPAGGLAGAIAQIAAEFQTRSGIAVDVTVDPAAESLGRERTAELTLVLREALTNVEKHASATRVRVAAAVDAGRLALTVEDDGVGFDPGRGAAHGGHGLASMRERAALLGGTFAAASDLGRGTRLTVTVPFDAAPVAPH